MVKVKLSSIVIPGTRFRREFDEKKILELKQSILRNGLFHPIVLEMGTREEEFVLRAGERRFRALQAIAKEDPGFYYGDTFYLPGFCPANLYSELNPLQRLEVEVEENSIRTDFTWQERIRALAALHELRTKQNPQQTIAATATEVLGRPAQGEQRMVVSDALIVSKYLHIPEVAKAKTQKDALKEIEKIATAGHRKKLADASLHISTPHKLIRGNTLELLSTLEAKSFDVILTDPPYGVDADAFGDMASTGHDYSDSKKYWEEIMQIFPDESYRVAKDRAHCYVFCDVRQFERLHTLMVLANWTVFPTPMIWVKSNGMLPFPDNGPRRTYECILFAWKGDRHSLMIKSDVINVGSVKKIKHGAQKPVALYLDILSRSANPGDHVLDCFGGTGPILVAANRMRLIATYIENEEKSFNIAQLRVNEKEIDDGTEENDGLGDIPF